MNEGAVSTILVVLLILIGVVSYYIYEYYVNKAAVASDIHKTNTRVTKEQTDRMGNDKTIVDQVNVVHDNIHSQFVKTDAIVTKNTAGINANTKNISGVTDSFNKYQKGMGSVLSFSKTGSTTPISVDALPSTTNPDMKLLSHVTSVGGLTIKDLNNASGSTKRLNICTSDMSKCIKIPDDKGNIYLTNLYKDAAISLDGRTVVNAPMSFNQAGKLGATITGRSDNTAMLKANAFGIGSVDGKPTASLHVMSDSSKASAPFKVTVNGKDVLGVDKSGTLKTTRIEMAPAGGLATTAVIQAVSDGIVLDAKNVYTTGDLRVNGVIYQSTSGVTQTNTLLGPTAPASSPAPAPTTTTTATSTSTAPATAPAPAPATTTTIAKFTDGPGPASMKTGGSLAGVRSPVDMMNQIYMLPVH